MRGYERYYKQSCKVSDIKINGGPNNGIKVQTGNLS